MDRAPVRITQPLLDVLEALLRAFYRDEELHGWAIMKSVARSGPTVYGVLDRLEDAGWVTARWERENPQSNRPRRRFYQVKPEGLSLAQALLNERRPDWMSRAPSPMRPRRVAARPDAQVAGGEP